MHLKMSSGKWRPFCLSLKILKKLTVKFNPSLCELWNILKNEVKTISSDAMATCVTRSSAARNVKIRSGMTMVIWDRLFLPWGCSSIGFVIHICFKWWAKSDNSDHIWNKLQYTVECHYNAIQYDILYTSLQWLGKNMNVSLNPQKTPHTSP